MNIYLVEQDLNRGRDTYDSFVCVAETEQEARETHPEADPEADTYHRDGKWFGTNVSGVEYEFHFDDWINFKDISKLNVN